VWRLTRVVFSFLEPLSRSHRRPFSPLSPAAMVAGVEWEGGLAPSSYSISLY
jgi:hypothetical protein